MSEKIKRCPQCGAESFYVSAHVVQDWKVDSHGTFLEAYNECSEVTHRPDNNDLWECANCGFKAPGSEFEVSTEETSDGANLDNGCTKILIRVRRGLVESVYCSDMNAEVCVEDLDVLQEDKDDDSGLWLDGSPIDENKLTQLY